MGSPLRGGNRKNFDTLGFLNLKRNQEWKTTIRPFDRKQAKQDGNPTNCEQSTTSSLSGFSQA